MRATLVLLAAAALLVPAEQARLHTALSLQKHVVFGAWFAAIAAGYALARLSRVDPGRGWAAVMAIPIAASTLFATMGQAAALYGVWPNSSALINVLRSEVQSHGGVYLAEDFDVEAYYLRDKVPWQRWEHVPEPSKTPPTALFVGRIEPRKAPELLVEAVQMLRRELPDVKAVFARGFRAGPDGRPQMFWANGKASILDGCDFLGHVADAEMEALLSKARVIVQPSALESFGLAAAEGMASGRPAIVTDTCGIADFIRQAAGGDVVHPGDPCALAAALKPYLCSPDLAKAVGTRAKNAVREQLDPDYIAARTEQLYERIHAA